MGEWRIANPHQTSTLENRRFVNMVDIREYDDRPGSRYVCEATPEDAERIVSAVSRAAALEAQVAALREALEFYADVRQYNRVGGDPVGADPPILWDGGLKARAALGASAPGDGERG